MKLTIIGAGNMGGAMIKGWATCGKFDASDITVADKRPETLEKYQEMFPGMKVSESNVKAVAEADVIVFAVKPWLIERVSASVREAIDPTRQIVVSVAANVVPDQLVTLFTNSRGMTPTVFYAIPNIAAEYHQSMTFLTSVKRVPEAAKQTVENLFSLIGEVLFCEEKQVEAGMMISSCGIAYMMRYLRANMQGGVEMGFSPKDALHIALQTMHGTVSLLEETGWHPEQAIDRVTTPGGVTIKGLNELDRCGFTSAVIQSLKAGLKK